MVLDIRARDHTVCSVAIIIIGPDDEMRRDRAYVVKQQRRREQVSIPSPSHRITLRKSLLVDQM